jgi:hypothetical protein
VQVSNRTLYRIVVRNPGRVSTGLVSIRLDGQRLEGPVMRLDDDGRAHEVEVVLGPGGEGAPVGPGRRDLPRTAPMDAEAE